MSLVAEEDQLEKSVDDRVSIYSITDQPIYPEDLDLGLSWSLQEAQSSSRHCELSRKPNSKDIFVHSARSARIFSPSNMNLARRRKGIGMGYADQSRRS